jgi:NAD(P)-dependent dehydrogenase (short-subunit alcohol dehydrogenase family)
MWQTGGVPPTIFITGAGNGLGFNLAEAFGREGWIVFAGYRNLTPAFQALASQVQSIRPVRMDVTDGEQVRAGAAEVARMVDKLDVLVNNAAILPEDGRGSIENMKVDVGLSVFDVNSLGPLRVTQSLLPLLRRGELRLILNVSSEAGSIGDCWRHDEYLYCMSKAALNMQTAILKNDLSRSGFRVMAVHPGWMRTEMGGPKADLDPRESAEALFRIITAPVDSDALTFIDYRGQPLNW